MKYRLLLLVLVMSVFGAGEVWAVRGRCANCGAQIRGKYVTIHKKDYCSLACAKSDGIKCFMCGKAQVGMEFSKRKDAEGTERLYCEMCCRKNPCYICGYRAGTVEIREGTYICGECQKRIEKTDWAP